MRCSVMGAARANSIDYPHRLGTTGWGTRGLMSGRIMTEINYVTTV